jgi:urease gamma subunit
MKRKKHKLKAHGLLLNYHEKLSYITHGILAKKLKVQ